MRLAFLRLAAPLFLGLAPIAVLLGSLDVYANEHAPLDAIAPDFRYGLYHQATELLHTGVAFDPPAASVTGENRIYTVLTTLLATPLTVVPVGAVAVIVTVLLIASAAATLRVLGVRDWRAYGAVFLWAPVISAVETGNLTLVLGLVAALAWRFRDRPVAAGALVGLAAALKVFMWPLFFWLLATRRFASAWTAAAVGLASILLVLPFGSPIAFFQITQKVAAVYDKQSYSLYVLLGQTAVARAVWLSAAVLVLSAAFFVADEAAFGLAMVACILFSPIVWIHYFALLLVPIAVVRPRFGPLWLVPLLYWAGPFGDPTEWQIVLALGALLCVALETRSGATRASATAETDLLDARPA